MDSQELARRIQEKSAYTWAAATRLEDFVIVTFSVAPEQALPCIDRDKFELDLYPKSNPEYALVSAVIFRDRDYHFLRVPWPKASFYQTNYRLYVRSKETGAPEVFFLGTTLGSPLAIWPRFRYKMPWWTGKYRTSIRKCARNDRYEHFEVQCSSAMGGFHLNFEEAEGLPMVCSAFENKPEQALILTHPVTGSYFRPDGLTGQYHVWHPKLDLRPVKQLVASFPFLESKGLIATGQEPLSVLVTRETEVLISLPPTTLR